MADPRTTPASFDGDDVPKIGAEIIPKIVLEEGARYSIEGRGTLRTLPCADEAEACRILWDEPAADVPNRSAVIFCFSHKRKEVDLKLGLVVRSRFADEGYVTGFRTDRGG